MSVENEIQELEHKLELKKAYLNVKISWGKGYKAVPEAIRKEVEENLRECAKNLAAGDAFSSTFTSEEVTVLKAVAAKVLEPKPKTPEPVKTEEPSKAKLAPSDEVQPEADNKIIGAQAELLLLDSIPLEQRKLVESGATVSILSQRSHRFFVEDPKGNRFWIPQDDIQFI